MSKKTLGKIVTLAALGIVATSVISYIIKYKSFHKELEDDFYDFEDEELPKAKPANKDRNYIALSSDKDNFVMAAKDTFEASKGLAGAAKEVLKDVGNIIVDNTAAAGKVVSDVTKKFTNKVADASDKVKDKAEDIATKAEDKVEEVADKAKDLADKAEDKAKDTVEEVADKTKGVADKAKDVAEKI